jgi:hypothetical protein
MVLGIPVEQYGTSYSFLAPASYPIHYLNIVTPTGAAVTLDGAALAPSRFSPIGATNYQVAREEIAGGTQSKVGITVYGVGRYTRPARASSSWRSGAAPSSSPPPSTATASTRDPERATQ